MLSASRDIEVRQMTTALGDWEIATWAPADLTAVVEAFWYFDGRLASPRERIFPLGGCELIVHLGAAYRGLSPDGAAAVYPATCLTGQQLRSTVIEAPPTRTAVLGIRLTPTGAFVLTGHAVHELTGSTTDLRELVGSEAGGLLEACADAPGAAGRLRAAAAWVRQRLVCGPAVDPAVAWACDRIDRRKGGVSVATLVERTGWSRTRFVTAFRDQVGVTPKTLARLARFRHALAALHAGRGSISDVAHASGYYDHAHFTGEFREICGFTPSAYRSALRYPNSVNLAESSETAMA